MLELTFYNKFSMVVELMLRDTVVSQDIEEYILPVYFAIVMHAHFCVFLSYVHVRVVVYYLFGRIHYFYLSGSDLTLN